ADAETCMSLNGLGVVKHRHDGDANARPRKTAMAEFARLAAKNVENEFNNIPVLASIAEAE
ncbi:hypothetical protein KKI24_29745, partial [bacterium]|nr:hypothetical protein [bacterium]